ncbi:70 kDa peptidyl-prolyl isomerase, partial [Bienertia sinuspersici]
DQIHEIRKPKDVLDHIKNFKEENAFFKKGEVDKALEKYGFAGVFLTCFEVKKEDDRVTYFVLASSIILKMAVCFLKKKEFMQVGHLCTLVLNFNSKDVKACLGELWRHWNRVGMIWLFGI